MEELNKILEDLIEHTTKELDKIVRKGDLTVVEVDNATKALCLIEKAEKLLYGESRDDMYSENGYYIRSYDDPMMSYERGRSPRTGRYVSRDGGPYTRNNGRYSGHSVHDRMIAKLESMMAEAPSDYERQVIEDGIKKLER